MRYLYTTNPDEHCSDFGDGIFGRPAHTYEQSRLVAEGWRLNKSDLSAAPQSPTQGEVLDSLSFAYQEKFGKKPHHKMKAETIAQKLEQADDKG